MELACGGEHEQQAIVESEDVARGQHLAAELADEDEVVRQVVDFSAQGLSNTVWAFASLKLLERRMMDAVANRTVSLIEAPSTLCVISTFIISFQQEPFR